MLHDVGRICKGVSTILVVLSSHSGITLAVKWSPFPIYLRNIVKKIYVFSTVLPEEEVT